MNTDQLSFLYITYISPRHQNKFTLNFIPTFTISLKDISVIKQLLKIGTYFLLANVFLFQYKSYCITLIYASVGMITVSKEIGY